MKDSRALAGFQKRIESVAGAMDKSKRYNKRDTENFIARALKRLARLAAGGRAPGKTYKPNGAKECARRVAQMNAGTYTPNYIKGASYV